MLPRFVILQVIQPHYHQELAVRNMKEAEQLVTTFGGEVIEKITQHRVKPHPNLYIGEGKFEELKTSVKDKEIDVVVINSIVNSGQLFRLEKSLWAVNKRIKVWDRVDLILHIFEQHATSIEAKLQIELARIEHIGPRVYGLGGTVLSRQGAGIGTKGIGETNTEIEKRIIKKRKQELQKKIADRAKVQQQRLRRRKLKGVKTVALVGYTSAGKTTLFNALTSRKKATDQGLFTTLDSVIGKMKYTPFTDNMLVSDTIGFIDDLPTSLIETFRSTLMESLEADILLHVIDAADPNMEDKITVVESILTDLNVKTSPHLVFNKSDLIDKKRLGYIKRTYVDRTIFFISAQNRDGIAELKQAVLK